MVERYGNDVFCTSRWFYRGCAGFWDLRYLSQLPARPRPTITICQRCTAIEAGMERSLFDLGVCWVCGLRLGGVRVCHKFSSAVYAWPIACTNAVSNMFSNRGVGTIMTVLHYSPIIVLHSSTTIFLKTPFLIAKVPVSVLFALLTWGFPKIGDPYVVP